MMIIEMSLQGLETLYNTLWQTDARLLGGHLFRKQPLQNYAQSLAESGSPILELGTWLDAEDRTPVLQSRELLHTEHRAAGQELAQSEGSNTQAEDLIRAAEQLENEVVDPSVFVTIAEQLAKEIKANFPEKYLNQDQVQKYIGTEFTSLSEDQKLKLIREPAYREQCGIALTTAEANAWRPKLNERKYEVEIPNLGTYRITDFKNSYASSLGDNKKYPITGRRFSLGLSKPKKKSDSKAIPQSITINYDQDFKPRFMSVRFDEEESYISYDFDNGTIVHRFPEFQSDTRVISNGRGELAIENGTERNRYSHKSYRLLPLKQIHSGKVETLFPNENKASVDPKLWDQINS